jgi:hypothetical protein
VSSSGYPLTTVVYAAINLSTSNTATLATLSKLLKFVAGAGQSVGTLPGQLPLGYLPLTSGMVSQTNAAAAAVASYTGPSSSSPSGSGSQASDSYYAGVGGSAAGSSDGSAAPGSGPTVTAVDASSSGRTPRVDAPPIVQAGLAVSLGFGLIGALVSPVVFRGRGRL